MKNWLILLFSVLTVPGQILGDGVGEMKPSPNLESSKSSVNGSDKSMTEELFNEEISKKMETEIEGYHEIKKRIQFLELHLKQHADFNLVDTADLVAAASTLQSLKRTIIEPLEANLLAVRTQIKKGHHNLTEDDIHLVKSVLENADSFLKNSNERLRQLELIENEWDSAEESEKIRLAAESKIEEHKKQKALGSSKVETVDNSPAVVRSKKQQKIKAMLFNRDRKNEIGSKSNVVDLREVKMKLDHEKLEDQEPGYGKKKINEALKEAAKKSHDFLDKEFHHEDENIVHMKDETSPPSWDLVFGLVAISASLLIILMYLVFSRPQNQPWKRNLFKSTGAQPSSHGGYCELQDVRPDNGETALTLNNLSTHPWSDSWTEWDDTNSQKQK
eukprot:TRINITY_DN1232_c0_g1_i1.p1 TRINITY_DN1232_c0_g1~~TRINITY_DN1232_c0_g1_i1.p1  ORF type:complete len:389 (-),score=79.43 TRINITY_DN1232_c0_g1_i1:107-1273(-)